MSNESMDLHVYVNVDDYSPKIGQDITWTITVHNNEAGDALDVNVSDVLPDGLKFLSGYSNDGSYSDGSGNWSIGTLKAGATATMEITTRVIDANMPITNRVEVSSSTHDCNPSNNAHSMTVNPWEPTEADLSIAKSVSNANPEVGSVVDWTVKVTNSGPDTAWNTTVVEALPDGLTPVGTTATMGNYEFNDGVWNVGHLNSGESAEMTMSTRIDSTQAAQYVNTASATSSTYDANTENNSASASVNSVVAVEAAAIVAEPLVVEAAPVADSEPAPSMAACCCSCDNYEEAGADLQVIKLVDNPTPDLNSPVVWSIMVTNNGPEEAINVVLNDNLPAGVEYVSNTVTMGEFSLQGGAWEIGDLASGASALLQLTTVATDAELTQVNIAMVSSDTEDNNPANDAAQASIEAVAADLDLVKSVDPEIALVGEDVEWTLTVTNHGPDAATNVSIEDVMPDGLAAVTGNATLAFIGDSWMSESYATSQGVSVVVEPLVAHYGDVEFNNYAVSGYTAGEMAADSSWTDSFQQTSSGADVVFLSFGANEFNKGNSLEEYQEGLESLLSQVGTMAPGSELVFIMQAEGVSSVPAHEWSEYVGVAEEVVAAAGVKLVNLGDYITPYDELSELWADSLHLSGAATDLVVQAVSEAYELPGMLQIPVSGVWDVGDLAVDQSESITINATVEETGEFTNVAQIATADQVDPDSTVGNIDGEPVEDDEASAILLVPEFDLELTQTISNEAPKIGEEIDFTITVTNTETDSNGNPSIVDGSGVSVSTQLKDYFDSGQLEFVSSNVPAFTQAAGDAEIWNIGDIAPGESVELVVTAKVLESGEITNMAQIATADQADIDSTPGNAIEEEDDQQTVTAEALDALTANPNVLEVEGTGGASINAVVVIDRSSSMAKKITIDGVEETRLEWNMRAVEEFAARPEVKAVKIIAFDGRVTDGTEIYDGGEAGEDKNYVPLTEVSEWMNASAASNAELTSFLGALNPDIAKPWGSGTNYQAAIDATMAQKDLGVNAPTEAEETNYYFFSDGVPTRGGTADHKLNDETAWQTFAENNFDNTYAVGFGGAISARDALEQVAHVTDSPDNPAMNDDPNLLLVNEIDAVPSVLNNFADTSVTGNVIEDDISINDFSITSMVFDGVTYSYANDQVTETGTSQGAILTNSFVVVDSVKEGSLQFDFETGDFTYFAPVTSIKLEETFDYTITDTDGKTSEATVTVNVAASPEAVNMVSMVDDSYGDLLAPVGDDIDHLLPDTTDGESLPDIVAATPDYGWAEFGSLPFEWESDIPII